MTMLENSAKWLDLQRQKYLSVAIEYHCRSGEIITTTATLGRSVFKAENEYGVTIRSVSYDFIISNFNHIPQRGDKILYHSIIYEVLAPNNEGVWRKSGIAKRIHTKLIGEKNEKPSY